MQDPYRVLNLPPNADAAAIKAAYRRLAKTCHPDRNPGDPGAEQRFKDVTRAYQLLGDPDKRAQFDRGEIDAEGRPRARYGFSDFGGFGGFGQQAGGGRRHAAGGFESIFEKAFGAGFGGFRRGAAGGGFGNAGAHPAFEEMLRGRAQTAGSERRVRGADLRRRLEIDFLEAANGGKERLRLEDGRTLEVDVPPGTTDGQVLRLKGQGRPGFLGGPAGDLLVEIAVQPHPHFVRKGDDIHLELPVSVAEALQGARIAVPTLDGQVRIGVPPGANTGRTLRLRGRGIRRRDGGRGDQYVRLLVVLPEEDRGDAVARLKDWAQRHPYAVRRDFDDG